VVLGVQSTTGLPDMAPRRTQPVHRKTKLLTLLVLAVCLILTACGSRRPMKDFVAAGSTANGGTTLGQGTTPGTQPGEGAQATTGPGSVTGPGSATGPGRVTEPGGSSSGAPQPGQSNAPGAPGANTASDTGVTATTINLGNIVTQSGAFGPDQFTAMYYGAAAYFDYINAHGGINGRRVIFNKCDDGGSSQGNQACARNLAKDGKTGVFAFVGDDCLVCPGLKYISDLKIPSVGGLAIDFSDYSLPYSWRYSGQMYPTDGKHIGYKGNLYEGTQIFHYFKTKMGMKKAAVIYYSTSAQSEEAGNSFVKALNAEGVSTVKYGENVGFPQWDSDVINMKANGIKFLFDSLDITGNQNLCKSIDSNGLVLTAKVSTVSTWAQSVGTTFDYPCRTYIYSSDIPGTLGYDQTSNPQIATFRQAWARYFPNRKNNIYEWNVDGWASAMWFTDAAASCGANLTRTCLINYLNRPQPYTAHGIWYGRNNTKYNFQTKKTLHQCITVSHWEDARKSFVTVGDYHNTCYTTPYIPYQAPPAASS
jgi:branched-chain amino acid transport system substrate-binding protein